MSQEMKFLWAAFSLLFWWGLACAALPAPQSFHLRAPREWRVHPRTGVSSPAARGAPPARRARHFLSAPRARRPALRPGRAAAAAAAASEVQVPPPGDSRLSARRPWHQAFTPLSRLTLRPPHRPAKCRPSPSPRRSVGSWKVTPRPSPRPLPAPWEVPQVQSWRPDPRRQGLPRRASLFSSITRRLLEPQDF